jgi:hypothetical protein
MMALHDECKRTVLIMQEQIDESSGALDNIQETVTTAVNDAISALTTMMTEDISKTIGTNMASASSSYKDALLQGSSAVASNAASNPAAVRLQAQAAISSTNSYQHQGRRCDLAKQDREQRTGPEGK